MGLNALIDTNVLIDFMTLRKPFDEDAVKIVDAADRSIFRGGIAAHSIPDIYYILRKSIPAAERREVLRRFCEIFTVVETDKKKLIGALRNERFTDFEDCLQSLCAAQFHADFIVTRNPKDFVESATPAILPDAFCRRFLSDSEGE